MRREEKNMKLTIMAVMLAMALLLPILAAPALAMSICHGQDCGYTKNNRHVLVICDTETDGIQAVAKGKASNGRIYTVKDHGDICRAPGKRCRFLGLFI